MYGREKNRQTSPSSTSLATKQTDDRTYTKTLAAQVSKAVLAATETTPKATSIKKHSGPGLTQFLR